MSVSSASTPVAVGQALQLPALAAAGPYTLTDLRLTDAGGTTLLPRPRRCSR